MSCCDASTVEMVNNSSVTLSVLSQDAENGSIHGLTDGTNIGPNGGNTSFNVYSGGGTQGKATGNVTLQDSNGNQIVLTYAFLPASFTGSCPCTPSGGTDGTGGYTVTIDTTTGSSDGKAKLQYNIS